MARIFFWQIWNFSSSLKAFVGRWSCLDQYLDSFGSDVGKIDNEEEQQWLFSPFLALILAGLFAQQMAQFISLATIFPTTLSLSAGIRTHVMSVSRVAPDWDLWRTLYRLSYSAAAMTNTCCWKTIAGGIRPIRCWEVKSEQISTD